MTVYVYWIDEVPREVEVCSLVTEETYDSLLRAIGEHYYRYAGGKAEDFPILPSVYRRITKTEYEFVTSGKVELTLIPSFSVTRKSR